MKSKRFRNLNFILHRYIGLVVGIILIVIGLTGSLLVFQEEIDHFLVERQFGQVVPRQQRASIETIINTVKTTYSDRSDFKLFSIDTLPQNSTYTVQLRSTDDRRTEVFVDPYSGKILGDRQWEKTLIGITFKLHYALLAGRTGEIIVGIIALLLLVLSITGIVLWPGLRKLRSGFKIKWQAHPKRVNFDIHKVAGIVTAVFLALVAFTGFCWNFYDLAKPAIYTVTLSPHPPEPVSQPIAGQSTLGLTEILKTADAALPRGVTTYITLPGKPEAAFIVYKKQPQELNKYGDSAIYLDQYNGKILWLQNGLEPSLGDRVLNSFTPLHYGTFWGLPSRILYLFVGLAPLILSITGYVMWWYRYRRKSINQIDFMGAAARQR
jgi:uncharacterized iron-regulated membrane protein